MFDHRSLADQCSCSIYPMYIHPIRTSVLAVYILCISIQSGPVFLQYISHILYIHPIRTSVLAVYIPHISSQSGLRICGQMVGIMMAIPSSKTPALTIDRSHVFPVKLNQRIQCACTLLWHLGNYNWSYCWPLCRCLQC